MTTGMIGTPADPAYSKFMVPRIAKSIERAVQNLEPAKVGAAVPYYAVFNTADDPDFSGITAPVLGHFGAEDDFAGPERARQIEQSVADQAGVDVTFHVHPGAGHAFFNDGNPFDTYDADLAEASWSTTLDFLRTSLS